jgi:hypothetical protein
MSFAAQATAAFLYAAEPGITAVASKSTQPVGLTIVPPVNSLGMTALAVSQAATSVEENYPNKESAWTPVDSSIFKLLKLKQLGSNWDGYDAAAPNLSSVEYARRFLRSLAPTSAVLEPTLHAGGNALLFLNAKDEYVEIEFFDAGRAEFFATRGDQEWSSEFYIDGAELPAGLREIGITI